MFTLCVHNVLYKFIYRFAISTPCLQRWYIAPSICLFIDLLSRLQASHQRLHLTKLAPIKRRVSSVHLPTLIVRQRARFGSKVGQIGLKLDNSDSFVDQTSVLFGTSKLFIMIWKSPWFDQFGANLTYLRAKHGISASQFTHSKQSRLLQVSIKITENLPILHI